MGLLSRISAGFDTPAEESPQINGGLSFFEFVAKHNLSHCAIFKRINTFYVFSHSWGFDGDTILQSISTSDFWEGTIENKKWNFFSRIENNLNTVLQFFSSDLRNNLAFVNIYQADDLILLAAFEEKPDYGNALEEISNDFLKIDFQKLPETEIKSSNDALKVSFTIKNAASETLGNLNSEIKTVMENAFFTETYAFLCSLLENPDSFTYCSENKNIFTIYLTSKSHITKSSVETFIKNALTPIFKKNTNLISYEY